MNNGSVIIEGFQKEETQTLFELFHCVSTQRKLLLKIHIYIWRETGGAIDGSKEVHFRFQYDIKLLQVIVLGRRACK